MKPGLESRKEDVVHNLDTLLGSHLHGIICLCALNRSKATRLSANTETKQHRNASIRVVVIGHVALKAARIPSYVMLVFSLEQEQKFVSLDGFVLNLVVMSYSWQTCHSQRLVVHYLLQCYISVLSYYIVQLTSFQIMYI